MVYETPGIFFPPPLPCLPPYLLSTFSHRYGFLLRVKAMGMGSSIDRERKIASYWARLMDEATACDDDEQEDDD